MAHAPVARAPVVSAPVPRAGGDPVPQAPVAQARYCLTDLRCDEALDLGGTEIAAFLCIELGYIDWCIEQDGAFVSGQWRVTLYG